jgi:zinc/manganese transport system substrate-binding protein
MCTFIFSRRRALLLAPILAAGLASPALAQPKPVVVASFSILGDMLRQIAGERVTLRVIAGPEADGHVFQPRPSDLGALRDAVLVVRNGLGFEPWLDRMLAGAGGAARVVTVTEGLPTLAGDPHAWQDIRLAQRYALAIGEGLAAALPAQATTWREGAAAYADRLAALDAWARAAIAALPEARRIAVTQHDAFSYLAAAYGLRFLSVENAANGEPGARRVAALIDSIRKEGVTALFTDSGHNQALMQRIARETGRPLRGRLYAESLSPPAGPAPTYEAMMRHNIGTLVAAMRAG